MKKKFLLGLVALLGLGGPSSEALEKLDLKDPYQRIAYAGTVKGAGGVPLHILKMPLFDVVQLRGGSTGGATLGGSNAFTGTNSFIDGNFSLIGSGDPTKIGKFEVDGVTAANTVTLQFGGTAVAPNFTLGAAAANSAGLIFESSGATGSFFYNFNFAGMFEVDRPLAMTGNTNLQLGATGQLTWGAAVQTPDTSFARGAAKHVNLTDGGTEEVVTLWDFGVSVQSGHQFSFSSSATDSSASNDTGISRFSAANLKLTDGSSGWGSLLLSKIYYNNKLTATVDGATTFTVTSTYMILACTGAETINTATGGTTGQVLVLEHTDTECTIADDDEASAVNSFNLTGTATNDVGATRKYLTFIFDGNAWQQTGESANN